MNEEEIIKILTEYLWKNCDSQIAHTKYEKCIILMEEIQSKVLERIHERWKKEGNGNG